MIASASEEFALFSFLALSLFLSVSLAALSQLVSFRLLPLVGLTSLYNRISRRVLSRLTRCNPIHSFAFLSAEPSRSLSFSPYPSHFPFSLQHCSPPLSAGTASSSMRDFWRETIRRSRSRVNDARTMKILRLINVLSTFRLELALERRESENVTLFQHRLGRIVRHREAAGKRDTCIPASFLARVNSGFRAAE